MVRDMLRVVRFRPYRAGAGPQFRIKVWDTGRRDGRGQSYLGYRLSVSAGGENAAGNPAAWRVLFEGEDFAGSPLHADDSDKTLAGLMGFLTLRPGDTDREYFVSYTPRQLEFCSLHAESLSAEVDRRFGVR